MPTVWIPALLRHLTDGQESVRVPGATLGEVIDQLDAKFPSIKARLCQGEDVRPGIAVVIDAQMARAGLSESVRDKSEIHFIPAVGGGEQER